MFNMIHEKLTLRFNLTLGVVSFYSAKGSLRPPTFGFRAGRSGDTIGFTVMSESGRFQVNITLNEMKNGKGRARTLQANQDSNRRQLIFYRVLYFWYRALKRISQFCCKTLKLLKFFKNSVLLIEFSKMYYIKWVILITKSGKIILNIFIATIKIYIYKNTEICYLVIKGLVIFGDKTTELLLLFGMSQFYEPEQY